MPTINKIVKRKTIDLNIKLKHDSFYDTPLWRNLRRTILNRDNGICKYCESKGIAKAGNIVDHILPRKLFPELEVDESNLVTCCDKCHNRKRYFEGLSKDRLQTKMNLAGAGFVFIKTNSK